MYSYTIGHETDSHPIHSYLSLSRSEGSPKDL